MPLTAEQFNEMDPAERARIAKMVSGQSPSVPGLPDFQAPTNFREGVGNIIRNVGQRIGEKYGTRESPTDLAARYRITNTVAAENRRRQLADLLIGKGAPAAIRNMSATALEKLYADRVGEPAPLNGGLAQKNLLTGVQTMLVQPPTVPTAVSEFEYMLQDRADRRSALDKQIAAESTPAKQAELRKQLEAFGVDPSYMQWANKQKAQAGGTSRYRWEELNRIDPTIKDLPPEKQRKLFLSTIRESPEEAGASARAEQIARDGGLLLTPGGRERDKLFAKTSIEYLTNGGRISSRRNMYELDGIIRQLKKNPKLTGIVEAALPDVARNKQSLAIQGDIERIIVMDLRATLGAQFTENESKAFVARSFNMLLPGDVNANRLQRMRAAISESQELYMDAIKYFQSNNSSLQGFEGKIFDKGDFEKAVFKAEDYDSVSDDKLQEMIQAGLKQGTIISDVEFEAIRLQLLKREQRK